MKTYINKQIKIALGILPLALIGLVVAGALVLSDKPEKSSALSGSDFQAGRIIDDAVFYNDSAMTVSQIQQFLNARVPNCDTNGDRMHWSGMTRRDWAAQSSSRDNPPYTCLKEYTEQIPSVSNSGSDLCTGNISGGNRSAARIIHDVGRACGINPQVLIVMLQKEQSLITDDWPWEIQYNRAMGYACPDSGPNNSANCNSAFYGFFNQVYNAAQAFRRYEANPTWYNYRANRNNSILYHPNTSCGNSNVFIENQATASLYIYTPYQPNQAALNNLYGTGNSCSSYGNRNFWRMFNDWFGSTLGGITFSKNLTLYPGNPPLTNEPVFAQFKITNTSDSIIYLGNLKVVVRDEDGNNYDFANHLDVSIRPGNTFTYGKTRRLPIEGNYAFRIARYDGNKWHSVPFAQFGEEGNGQKEVIVQNAPTITSLDIGSGDIHAGQTINATFDIINNSNYPFTVGRTKVAVRDKAGNNLDFNSTANLTLGPNETYSYSESRRLPRPGLYNFRIANHRQQHGWSNTFPRDKNSSVMRTLDLSAKAGVTTTESLSIEPTNLHINEIATATFEITNHTEYQREIGKVKVVVRDSVGRNHDFPSSDYIILSPGEKYTYEEQTLLPRYDKYSSWIASYRNTVGWNSSFPVKYNNSVAKSKTIDIKHRVTITSSLNITQVQDNEYRARFQIRNHSIYPVELGRVKVVVRDSKNNNRDFPSSKYMVLEPGEVYEYDEIRSFNIASDKYMAWISSFRESHGWSTDFPFEESSAIYKSLTFSP